MYHVHPHLAEQLMNSRLDDMRRSANESRRGRQVPRRQRHRQRR